MITIFSEEILIALAGAFGGILLGLAARLGRFCTLGAIEDHLYSSSNIRLRMWSLAIGLSIVGTFTLSQLGLVDLTASRFLTLQWNPLASIIGGLLFGYGMAICGNCGYGALARLGGGDLRAFVIVLVLGISTYFFLSGPIAGFRLALFNIDLTDPGRYSGFSYLFNEYTGISGGVFGIFVALNSHTFAAPVGETILYSMNGSAIGLSFGIGSVFGVLIGAFIGSIIKGHFRWEACEDPRELRRQIIGATIMGAGAVIALGCSVGQGLTAFSVLSFSAPVTIIAIYIGARLGLKQLIEGFQPAE
ncbi:MAG: YeeE/YedE family protein [Rhodobacteraceae bacterium]|nr:YeeE/YedE family protein [Paracoccaceae bacterium]